MDGGRETDIVIPVMGPTGAGKSTFINTLLGTGVSRMEVGHKLISCTIHLDYAIIDPKSIGLSRTKGRVIIVDTPGFDDTYEEDVEILRRIAVWLASSYQDRMKLGGVVYLHDISRDRFSGTARRNLEMFHRLCGDDALRNVVLGTTKWSRVSDDEGMGREDELQAIHWKTMIDGGSTVRRFSSTTDSARKIVSVILDKFEQDTALRIQKELVSFQKLVPETEAGKKLRYTLQQVLEMQKQMAELEAASAKAGDPHAETKLKEIQEKISGTLKQIQELKLTLPLRIRRLFRML